MAHSVTSATPPPQISAPLFLTKERITVEMEFRMHVMFKHDAGSIAVPIFHVDWWWVGMSEKAEDGSWSLVDVASGLGNDDPVLSSELPSWTRIAINNVLPFFRPYN